MRSYAAFQTCVTVLLALLAAPFQHVHAGADHDHAGVVHAHFFHLAASPVEDRGPRVTDADDDHADVRSLDTFTLVITAGFAPFVLSSGPDLQFVPSRAFPPTPTVEERGNSPPAGDRSIPRAPPS